MKSTWFGCLGHAWRVITLTGTFAADEYNWLVPVKMPRLFPSSFPLERGTIGATPTHEKYLRTSVQQRLAKRQRREEGW